MKMPKIKLDDAMEIVINSLPATECFELCISTDREHVIYWNQLRIPFTAENYTSRLGLIEALINAKAYFD